MLAQSEIAFTFVAAAFIVVFLLCACDRKKSLQVYLQGTTKSKSKKKLISS